MKSPIRKTKRSPKARRSPVRKASPRKTRSARKVKSPARKVKASPRRVKSPVRKASPRRVKSPVRKIKASPRKVKRSPVRKTRSTRKVKASPRRLSFAFPDRKKKEIPLNPNVLSPREAALKFLNTAMDIVGVQGANRRQIVEDELSGFTSVFQNLTDEKYSYDDFDESQEYLEELEESSHEATSDIVSILDEYFRNDMERDRAHQAILREYLRIANEQI